MRQTSAAAEALQKDAQCGVRSRRALPVSADHQADVVAHAQFLRPLDFCFDVGGRRTDQAPGSGGIHLPFSSRRRSGNREINRATNLTHREYIYRMAYEVGRHIDRI